MPPAPVFPAPAAERSPGPPADLPSGDYDALVDRLRDTEKTIRRLLDELKPVGGSSRVACVDGGTHAAAVELSVVMPCLNEGETLAACIEKAQRAMREAGIAGEVVIADNGSTDGSVEIARRLGARVVEVAERGYGAALMGGIEVSTGTYVVMGDADNSYDFLELPKFVAELRAGNDLVQGCRLPSGGGRVMPGAMPALHRWWGNPMFTLMVRRMFAAPVHDVYCGLRGFTRELYDRLDLRSTGMEFATEMIIKSSLLGVAIAEAPTTLYPDGRTAHAPHLRTFRDGWRTLRFFLMYSPRWLFLAPGVLLCLLGVLGYALALPGATIAGARLDAHTLLVASLALLLGNQALHFAVLAKTFAVSEGLLPESGPMRWVRGAVTLERSLLVGAAAVAAAAAMLGAAAWRWWALGFGPLDYARTMRWVIPGVTLATLGCQTMLSGFLLSILRMARK